MGMISEFKEFAVKGNAVDMAVGIIVGAGFGKIVSSLVADVIMPPIGLLVGGVDFTGLKIILREAVEKVPAVTLNYGTFVQTVVDFSITAFAVFMMLKGINSIRKPATPPPAIPVQEQLLMEIRDLLKTRN